MAVLNSWPCLPSEWHKIEVPFQLRVGTPRVVALFGLKLVNFPLRPGLRDYNPRLWCLWCPLHTIYVLDVVTEWIRELRTGRLFWLPDGLVEAIHEIGLDHLTTDFRVKNFLQNALRELHRVRWERVDPACSTRPLRNDFEAPIFHSGDVVPFDAARGELNCVGQLSCHPRCSLRCENPCGPDLRQWREIRCGNGLAPV